MRNAIFDLCTLHLLLLHLLWCAKNSQDFHSFSSFHLSYSLSFGVFLFQCRKNAHWEKWEREKRKVARMLRELLKALSEIWKSRGNASIYLRRKEEESDTKREKISLIIASDVHGMEKIKALRWFRSQFSISKIVGRDWTFQSDGSRVTKREKK